MNHTKNKPLPTSPYQGRSKSGFTLVELIVTITIIAILWAIAFTAFNGFQSSARDSTRASDLANLSQALDTSYIKSGSYPNPDNSFTVTYSGWSLWYQWTVWDTLINTLSSNGSKLSKKPTDPLAPSREYTYSKSAYGNTFELSSNWEWDRIALNTLIPQVSAASGNPTITYIKGNYNGMVAKTVTGSTVYVIATPSLTTSTGTAGSSIDVTTLSGKLLYHGQTNSGWIAFTPTLIYSSGSLPTNDTNWQITTFTTNLKTAYSGSVMSSNSNIQNVLTTTGATNITSLWASIITNYLGGSASAPPPPPVTSYSLSNSLMFDSASAQYLSRTPSVGNQKKWTANLSLKRAKLGTLQYIFGSSYWTDADTFLAFNTSDQLIFVSRITNVNGSSFEWYGYSTRVFRDPSAWYNISVSVDTTIAHSNNNDYFTIKVNNEPITFSNFGGVSLVSAASVQNINTNWNRDTLHTIGSYRSSGYFDGYLADVNFVDSGALDPTSFGYADPTTNQWLPKQYIGSYGTNGFHLDFSSGASLGKDANGTNDWTVNGWMTPALNQVIDTPLNNFATLNPLGVDAPVLSNPLFRGNLTVSSAGSNGKRSTIAITSLMGKYYWESLIPTWAASNFPIPGLCVVWAGTYWPGYDANSIGYYQGGGIYYNGTLQSNVNSFVPGDVIGIAYDAITGKIWFSKNGVWQGTGTPDPSSGTLPNYTLPTGIDRVPTLYTGVSYGSPSINFWQWWQSGLTNFPSAGGYFKFQPPTGFKALSTANLPDPTIKNPKQYFDVLTYTGDNTSTRTISAPSWMIWLDMT